ncbi:MAG TPA: TolC family protein, partial [bacterium]
LGFGAQKLYGDRSVETPRFGFGGDGSLTYRLSNGVGVTITAGYNQIPYYFNRGVAGYTLLTNKLFYGDFKLDLELLPGGFRPYVTVGVGAFNYGVGGAGAQAGRSTSTAFVGGGGLRFGISQRLLVDFGTHYKFTTDDDLDNGIRGGMSDGFLTMRAGMTFLFGNPFSKAPVEAEPSPVAEVEGTDTTGTPTTMVDSSGRTAEVEKDANGSHETVFPGAAQAYPALRQKLLSEGEINDVVKRPLTLDDCIRIALSKNIPLQLAKGELAKAEATYTGSSGKFYPVFTFDSTIENTLEKRPSDLSDPTAPVNNKFDNQSFVGGIQQYLPTGATLQITSDLRRDVNSPDIFGARPDRTKNQVYSFSITQPLLRDGWPLIARSSINRAGYDWQIQEKNIFNAKLETIFAVKSAFYNTLLERELIEVHWAAIQRDSTLVKAAESRVQAKLATRLDILSAEIRLAQDRAALIKSQTDSQIALDLLKEVMGLPLQTPIELQETKLSFSPLYLDEAVLIRSALETNPLIQGQHIAIPRSQLDLNVAKNALLPRLDLIAEYTGRYDQNTDQGKNLSQNGWLARILLSYPFLNREASANVQNARITLSQEQDRLVNLQRQIELGILEIVRTVYSSAEEINALKRSVEVAEEKISVAMAMYNLGRASNLDITDAQEASLEAKDRYLRKLVEYHTQLALLESLTGLPVQ